MLEVILLALALSMDAFAVAIGLGSMNTKTTKRLALLCGSYFGLFHFLMPMLGYLVGQSTLNWFDDYAKWVSFVLLVAFGLKMVFDSTRTGITQDILKITHRLILILAIATSIDAMATGFTIALLKMNAIWSCLIIGLTTFGFSFAGVFIAAKSGDWLENKAQCFGGIILILVGIKIAIV